MCIRDRTNTVLQAAFFKIANIIPIDDAVKYMKDAIKKTFGKKGDAIVNMNNAAVDAGLDGAVEVEIPASWAEAKDIEAHDDRAIPSFVKEIVEPVNAQKGDDLPVSAFVGKEDGTFPLGTAAFEKRGVSPMVPVWDSSKCIQCNQLSLIHI